LTLATELYGRLKRTALAVLTVRRTMAAPRHHRLSKLAFVASALQELSYASYKASGACTMRPCYRSHTQPGASSCLAVACLGVLVTSRCSRL
jgi:hypothetical protein